MFKLFIFSAILALGAASKIDFFLGEWKAVKVFSSEPRQQECEAVTITELKDYCTCSGDDKTSKVKMQIGEYYITQPTVIVNSFDELTNSFKETCTCDGKTNGHYSFYRLSDNYFLMFYSRDGYEHGALVAKSLPTQAEVTEFLRKYEFLKEKTSYFICTQEIMHSNESKVTTGKKWWRFEKK